MKQCTQCNLFKNKSDFGNDKRVSNGLKAACKYCENLNSLTYLKTKNGLINQIYNRQKSRSKKRGHNPPTYTLIDFSKWIYSQSLFEEIYNKRVDSGYEKKLKPSIDRIDDYKGYSFVFE